MKTLSFAFVLLACLALRPVPTVFAQDGCGEDDGCDDGCSSIEMSDDPDPDTDQEEEDAEEEEERQRKKNAGLAGGGARDKGDVGAPKLKMSLQDRVNKAIKAGVKFLKARQDKDGSYGPVKANSKYGQPKVRGDFTRDETGPTSFALYTLAKCGVKKSDKRIRKGLRWLKDRTMVTNDTTGKKPGTEKMRHNGFKGTVGQLTTYESASIVLMIEAIYQRSAKLTGKHNKRKLYAENPLKPPARSKIPKEDWLWLHDRILHLTKGRRISSGGARGKKSSTTIKGTQNANGGWRYGQANGDQDLSATQFVLLALRAASQAGYPMDKVAPDTFKWAANYVKKLQMADGAFSYQGKGDWTACMDACGIGSLVICKEQMALMGQTPPAWIDGAVKKGLGHLNKIWDATKNASQKGNGHHYYHLYGVERVGDLTGRSEFNGKNWYFRGANFLLAQQAPDGSWTDAQAYRPRDVIGTCFALLFLKRATIPTVTITDASK